MRNWIMTLSICFALDAVATAAWLGWSRHKHDPITRPCDDSKQVMRNQGLRYSHMEEGRQAERARTSAVKK